MRAKVDIFFAQEQIVQEKALSVFAEVRQSLTNAARCPLLSGSFEYKQMLGSNQILDLKEDLSEIHSILQKYFHTFETPPRQDCQFSCVFGCFGLHSSAVICIATSASERMADLFLGRDCKVLPLLLAGRRIDASAKLSGKKR